MAGEEADDAAYRAATRYAQQRLTDPSNAVLGGKLIAAYRLRYGDEKAGWAGYEIINVEEVLVAHDLHSAIGGYAAIADVVLRDGDGRLVVAERKTAARMPSGEEEQIDRTLKTRPQLLGLAWCARDQYGETPLVVHDLITKTKTTEFLRRTLEITDDMLDEWAEEQEASEEMVGLKCQNRDMCDPPSGWRCQYFDYCHGSTEQREQLYQIRRSRD